MAERPQYYKNGLEPIEINREELQKILKELRDATKRGADLAQKNSPPVDQWGNAGFFLGVAGIALAFLRLDRLAPSLQDENETSPLAFRQFANQRIFPTGPDLPLIPSRLSPLGSATPLAAAVVRILSAASSGDAISKDDILCHQQAVDLALKNGHVVPHGPHNMGGDEMLYGRTGLLWSILNIRTYSFDEETRKAFEPVFEAVPKLVDVIVTGGRQGLADYREKHGEMDALPLMWPWMPDHYSLGSVHGAAGILSVLLACKVEEINDTYFLWIAETITGLCQICIANNGHLPMTIPPLRPGSSSNIVQVCHGSPGILLLMACVRRNVHMTSNYWQPEWDEAMRLACDRTWEEGMLSKGGGLCHGIAGNAWPLLLAHDAFQYGADQMETAKRNYEKRMKTTIHLKQKVTGDYFLSRGLAFLLHARETPPYNTTVQPSSNDYRMPDTPYSLSEGVTGTVCAWASACVTIQTRLRQMELAAQGTLSSAALQQDSAFQELERRQLGFPTLGYYRPAGML